MLSSQELTDKSCFGGGAVGHPENRTDSLVQRSARTAVAHEAIAPR